jgi:hypothetical protein
VTWCPLHRKRLLAPVCGCPLREGANRFAPSSVESVVLTVMQSALGDRRGLGLAVAARLGPRYLQRISEAAGRLRPEIGDAQIPLPLQGD